MSKNCLVVGRPHAHTLELGIEPFNYFVLSLLLLYIATLFCCVVLIGLQLYFIWTARLYTLHKENFLNNSIAY